MIPNTLEGFEEMFREIKGHKLNDFEDIKKKDEEAREFLLEFNLLKEIQKSGLDPLLEIADRVWNELNKLNFYDRGLACQKLETEIKNHILDGKLGEKFKRTYGDFSIEKKKDLAKSLTIRILKILEEENKIHFRGGLAIEFKK